MPRLSRASFPSPACSSCTSEGCTANFPSYVDKIIPVQEGILVTFAAYEGAIDILVPNVGALIAGPFETLSSEQWQEAFSINFFTYVYACHVKVPLIKQ